MDNGAVLDLCGGAQVRVQQYRHWQYIHHPAAVVIIQHSYLGACKEYQASGITSLGKSHMLYDQPHPVCHLDSVYGRRFIKSFRVIRLQHSVCRIGIIILIHYRKEICVNALIVVCCSRRRRTNTRSAALSPHHVNKIAHTEPSDKVRSHASDIGAYSRVYIELNG